MMGTKREGRAFRRRMGTARHPGLGRTRSRILLKITLLLSTVIIISGIATFFLVRDSQQNLADKCEGCLLETMAGNCSDAYNNAARLLYPTYAKQFTDMRDEDLVSSTISGEITEAQKTISSDVGEMLDSGFLGLQRFMLIIPPQAFLPEAMVWASDDQSLIYNWDVPEDLTAALKEDDLYIWREDGVPELGLDGEYLITLGKMESPYTPGLFYAYVAFRPMSEEMVSIQTYFNQEKRSANLLLVSTIAASMAVILAAVFFLLGFLIHRNITKPLDELSEAAGEVMQGNLDVEIEVREGEEFADLKLAFKRMVEGFREYIDMSVGEGLEKKVMAGDAAKPARQSGKRSSILWHATAILVVIMAIYGVGAYFVLRHAQDNLIDNGIDRMVQAEVDDFRSSLDYTINISVPRYVESFKSSDLQVILADLAAGRISELQETVNEDMRNMVDNGFHDIRKVMLVVPPSGINTETIIWASNDERLIYGEECPHCLIEAIENGDNYLFLSDGISELGVEGECLITINKVENPLMPSMPFVYIAAKPMAQEMAAIDDFCGQERARANLYLAFILEGSIILVILIAFLFLRSLIRKEVVEPVAELSAAADRVMHGDLDVSVSVREGEELEGLKRAFNEMVASMREMFSRFFGEKE
jgi:methyl-accepting chemotaxis protein